MACEKCWNDAYLLSKVNGRSQSYNYQELIVLMSNYHTCTMGEQLGIDKTYKT